MTPAAKSLWHILASSGVKIGPVTEVLVRQDKEFVDWLLKQTPPGLTLSETLIAIATDQYNEEKDDNTVSRK